MLADHTQQGVHQPLGGVEVHHHAVRQVDRLAGLGTTWVFRPKSRINSSGVTLTRQKLV